MDEALPIDESAVDSRQSAEDQSPVTSHQSPELVPEPEPIEEMPDPAEDLGEHLLDVRVRVWGELGRARLPLAEAVALGTGAIVDLDKEPEEDVDIYVNGMPFAKGTLLLVDGEWAVRLGEIVASPAAVEHASSSASEA